MRAVFFATILLVCVPFAVFGQLGAAQKAAKAEPSGGLSVDDIVALASAGISEDLIITKIKKNGKAFDLNTEQILQLKKAGVTNNVMKAMLDPGTDPAAAAPAPAAVVPGAVAPRVTAVPAKPKEEDPVLSRLPAQAGMYCLRGGELVKIDLKTLASAKTAGRLGHTLTLGVKSVKTNAYLIGPSAKTRVQDTSPVFYVRLPEGTSIDEVALVSLYVKPDRRELEVSAKSGFVGSKQGLRMETMKPFESEELAPNVYKIATSILGRGEYLFYLVGSADQIKGIQGKGYDFSVQ